MTRDGGKTWNERHVAHRRPPGAHAGDDGARVALRAGARVRDVRRPLQRRLQAVRLRERRLRAELALARGRTAGDVDQPDPRTSAQSARADPRALARRALLERRRRDVELARDQHADRADRRRDHPSARQRADRRHARPRHLDPRRRRPARGADRRCAEGAGGARADSARPRDEHLGAAGVVRPRRVLRAESRSSVE